MAKGNTTLAIDKPTRDKLNEFVQSYNKNLKEGVQELTAKDFISIALDYFIKNNIDISFSNDSEIPYNEDVIINKMKILLEEKNN